MLRSHVVIVVAAGTTLLVGACSSETPAPEPVVSEPTALSAPDAMASEAVDRSATDAADGRASGCPTGGSDTRVLVDSAFGFCVAYPIDHSVFRPTNEEVMLAVGSPLDTEHPRAFIEVTPADGGTADAAADAVTADVAPPFEVARSETTLGGEPAVELDGVPGQDISRQVFAVHNDRLYRLTVVPTSPDRGEVHDAALDMYRLMVESFAFLPE